MYTSGSLGFLLGIVTLIKVYKNIPHYMPISLILLHIFGSLFFIVSGIDFTYAKSAWRNPDFKVEVFMPILMVTTNAYMINTFCDYCICMRYLFTSINLYTDRYNFKTIFVIVAIGLTWTIL